MQIQVNVNNLSLIKADELNENEYNIHSIQFIFSSDYEGNLAKVALFTSNDETYKVIITNNECSIPPEVLANNGCFVLGVYAFEVNGDELIERYSPSPISLYIQNGSYIADENTENSEPLTPTDKEQIESLIAQWQQELTQKMQEVNTAINETNNLNLDVNKVEKTTTVILTKKDGATKRVQIDDGISLEFMWQGTSLGIKTDDQSEYTFVDLQGVQGPKGDTGAPFVIKKTYPSIQAMDADFNNMQLGDYVMIAGDVETEDNAKLFTRGETQWIFISDFSGAQGIQGPTGLTPNIQIGTVTQGTTFNVTRTGTNENPVLNFTLVKGDKGDTGNTGPTGPTGNGIQSIRKTGTDGLVDTYTITFTNGSTTTFTVTNGEDGEVTETELDVLRQKLADQQMVINQLPQVSGSGTEVTLNNTIEAPMTQFDLEGNSTQETTSISGGDEYDSPSPEHEQPIKSAGDDINLFDKDNAQIVNNIFIQSNKIFGGNNYTKTLYIECKPNTTYTIQKQLSARFFVMSSINIPKLNEQGSVMNYNNSATNLTITTGSNDKYLSVFYYKSDVDTLTEQEILDSIKIQQGSIATPFSPYGMGSITEKIVNKNWCNGISQNCYLNIGTTNAGIISGNSGLFIEGRGKTYTISTTKVQERMRAACINELPVDSATSATVTAYRGQNKDNTSNSITIDTSGYKYLIVNITDLSAVQIEEGSTATTYTAHEEQTYTIPTQAPMRSIGDVRDEFVKVNGNWFERHYIYRKIFNGTETNVTKGGTTNNTQFIISGLITDADKQYLGNYNDDVISKILCNYFKAIGTTSNNNGSVGITLCKYSPNPQIRFGLGINSTITTVADFKDWLAQKYSNNNPVYMDYILLTPIDLPCTEEQIAILENMPKSYSEQTNIYSSDETPAFVEAKGIFDLNNLINS